MAEKLKENNYLVGYNKEDFVKEFTEAFAKVNHAHPFLDGNGRSTRVLFSQLADNAGFDFDVSNIDKDEWDYASLKSGVHEKLRFFGLLEETYQPDTRLLHKLMERAISEKEQSLTKQTYNKPHEVPTNRLHELENQLSEEQKVSLNYTRKVLDSNFKDNPELLAQKHEELNSKIPDIVSGKIALPTLTKQVQPDIEVRNQVQEDKGLDR